MKVARARTGRSGFLYAGGAFHGLTMGALSLMGDDFWRQGFGPLLADCHAVPFGDVSSLKSKLESQRYAAFVLEPLQGEAGICVPPPEYLKQAENLCRQYGTLLVLDEVQTGLARTGKFLAYQHYGVEPDMLVLAKALSAGLATLEVIDQENLVERAGQMGAVLREKLQRALNGYEMVEQIRGVGLFCG